MISGPIIPTSTPRGPRWSRGAVASRRSMSQQWLWNATARPGGTVHPFAEKKKSGKHWKISTVLCSLDS